MAYINASGAMDNGLGLIERIQIAKVTLTAAQVIAMNTAPVSILPAPGAGLVIVPMGPVSIQVKPGGTQFAGGGTVNLVYTGGAIAFHAGTIPAATINSASASNNLLPPIAGVIQPPSNTGVSITNATAAFSAGTGTLTVKVAFAVRVID